MLSASRMTAAALPPNVEEKTVMPTKLNAGIQRRLHEEVYVTHVEVAVG